MGPSWIKDTGKLQPDGYGPGPDFSKSDFEDGQDKLAKQLAQDEVPQQTKLQPEPVK